MNMRYFLKNASGHFISKMMRSFIGGNFCGQMLYVQQSGDASQR